MKFRDFLNEATVKKGQVWISKNSNDIVVSVVEFRKDGEKTNFTGDHARIEFIEGPNTGRKQWIQVDKLQELYKLK